MQFEIKFKNDLDFGLQSENENIDVIQKYFNCSLVKTGQYNEFDYVDKDKKILIELKTRKNTLNTYPTTMIGYNKILKAIDKKIEGYTIYFCFQFTDYLCYYIFEKDNVKWQSIGGRKDRGCNEIKQYYYIPVNNLKTITNI